MQLLKNFTWSILEYFVGNIQNQNIIWKYAKTKLRNQGQNASHINTCKECVSGKRFITNITLWHARQITYLF